MAFLDLVDRSGRIQLQARADVLGEEPMATLLDLDLGDLVGVDGTIFRSRRGELTLRVDAFTVLAKSLRPPPDKHHGLTDVETRFRRRELDLIGQRGVARASSSPAPRSSPRSAATSTTHGFIEVETPGAAAALRRRARAAVRDAPQPARPRLLPAHRDRALPQAAASSAGSSASTSSARTSATRASRSSTTPSSRWSSGTRPTPTTTDAMTRARDARRAASRTPAATRATSTSARRGAA